MMDSSALRDTRDPSRAVTMTTRIIAPVGAFALGAYAENRGYVDAALRKAREMDPTIRTGVDALFAAMGDDARTVTTTGEKLGKGTRTRERRPWPRDARRRTNTYRRM